MQLSKELSFFAKYIEDELGIIYAEHNYFQLQNRLEDIAKLMTLENIPQLFAKAQAGISGQFKQLLLDTATNNETSFFRDAKLFTATNQTVIPELFKAFPNEAIYRIWSAAASTGQEAVSLSIGIEEAKARFATDCKFEITASDVSDRVLTKAKSGIYTQLEAQRGLPASFLIKYFQKTEDDHWKVKPCISDRIIYQKLNLKEAFRFGQRFHLIFLRNVLIYQTVESKIAILKHVTEQLMPGGYLALGSGESLLGLSNDYETSNIDGAILYMKRKTGQITAA